MKLSPRDLVRSFPIQATGIVVIAFVFGMLLAVLFTTSPTAISVPTKPTPTNSTPKHNAPDRVEYTADAGNESAPEPAPPEDPPEIDQPPDPSTRDLSTGRVDPLVRIDGIAEPTASITVTVENNRGHRLPFDAPALAVWTPALEWQDMNLAPERVEAGVWRFSKLNAGRYKVRNTLIANAPASEEVPVTSGAMDIPVTLTVYPKSRGRVQFYPRLPDGSVPDVLTMEVAEQRHSSGGQQSRFNETETSPFAESGSLGHARMSYRPNPNDGSVAYSVVVGTKTQFLFSAQRDKTTYSAEMIVEGTHGNQTYNVELKETDVPATSFQYIQNFTLTLTLDGEESRFSRVNLRRRLEDSSYVSARQKENAWQFLNVTTGRWFLTAEHPTLHAAYVAPVTLDSTGRMEIDIQTARLRVRVTTSAGFPLDLSVKWRVMLAPRSATVVASTYTGTIKDASDHIDFVVPVEPLEVTVNSPEGQQPLAFAPDVLSLSPKAGAQEFADFTLSAGAHLKFRCVDGAGVPVAGAEYLLTTHPSGKVPVGLKSKVKRVGSDGRAEVRGVSEGPIYLHVWTTSKDWDNPDRVFRLDLPAFGVKDLGAIQTAD